MVDTNIIQFNSKDSKFAANLYITILSEDSFLFIIKQISLILNVDKSRYEDELIDNWSAMAA